ncbi:hypothetical protein EJ065_3911 [Corallococcus coralloides]|uniref:Uncharacterized protein n=1 Tax=Corallococcus coralloides TaxID=184914 RepID=A0A410RUH6_CORCK|nr:hypothetical protein [Corallococcus coralloides]QAT85471.1 hypothetical protein EJ065_3911 [Corallococcus coralloides]
MSTISSAGSSSGVSQVGTTWEPEPAAPPPPPPPPPPEPQDAFVPAPPRKGPDLLGYGAMASTSVSSTQAAGDSASTVNVAEAWTLLTQGYAQARDHTGAANAALEKAAGNPALQAKLMDLLQATPARTLEDALTKDFAHGVKEAVPNPPPRPPGITSVGTLRVADSALEAVAKQGNPTTMKPALEAAAKRGHLLPADRDVLVSCLGSAGAAVDAKLDTAVSQVHAAEQAYSTALAERNALEQRLAGDIASFGPYLTDNQQRAYIEEFRKLHGKDYARFDEKAKALETTLAKNAPQLEQALRGPDGSAHARSIQAAYTALAQSKSAGEALKWAAKMEAPGSAFAPFMKALPLDTVREKSVSGALVSFYEKFPNATPTQAVDEIQKLLVEGYLAQQLGGAKADLQVNNLPQAMRTGLAGLRDLAAGNSQKGLKTLQQLESRSSPWGTPFAAAGLVLGVLQTKHSAGAKDPLGTLWAGTFTAQQMASLTSTALSAVNKSGGALVATRFAGGLGAFGAALDLVVQGKEIAAGQGNAGTGMSIAGDAMGIVGGALIAMGSTGVGVPLAAAGAAVYLIGELVSMSILSRQEYEAASQLRAEQRTLLTRAGADAEQVTNLERYSSPEQVESLVKSTGWTRDQVLQLGKTFPDFFPGAASTLPQLDKVANDFGLTPDQRYRMLLVIGDAGSANAKGNADALGKFAEAVRNYPKNTVGITVPPGLSKKDQWIHFLRELGNRLGSYDGLGPRNAAIFLERLKR